jgi:hypothetical protein
MLSTQGPRIAKGDINKDGLEDIYICGAKDQSGVLYRQTPEGRFIRTNEDYWKQTKAVRTQMPCFLTAMATVMKTYIYAVVAASLQPTLLSCWTGCISMMGRKIQQVSAGASILQF